MLIFRRTIVLLQHLVLSLSFSDCSVHRLREDVSLLYFNTFILLLYMFRALYAHLQEDNCIITASGIVTLFR